MAAFVEHRFPKGFLLDEERLRKLINIIDQRLSKAVPQIHYSFKVFKADSYSYETDRVEDIISEDNADWRRITRLEIGAEREKDFKFQLSFSDDGTTVKLVGNDRDQVYLLFSDLREYLKNEVNVCLSISRDTRRLLPIAILLLSIVAVVLVALYWRIIPTGVETKTALATTDLSEKLNFIISHQKNSKQDIFPVLFAFMLFLSMILIGEYSESIILFFFPSNLFLFGIQKQKYERRRRMSANILWGILVAFVISVLAGLAVWKMTT